MLRFNSLQTRILVLTTVPLAAIVVGFLALTLRSADHAVRTSVSTSLSDAGSVFVKLLATRRTEVLTMASVTGRDPRFFATLSIPDEERGPEFAPTLRGVAADFLRITDADFIEVFDGHGKPVCYVDQFDRTDGGGAELGRGGIETALRGTPITDFYLAQGHLVVAGIVPVFVSQHIEAVLRMGSFFDRDFVAEVKRLTGAEVCLMHAGQSLASTYPDPSATTNPAGPDETWSPVTAAEPALGEAHFAMSRAYTTTRAGTDYLVVRVNASGVDPQDGFDAYLGRELDTELAPMVKLGKQLAVVGSLTLLCSVLAAWFVAKRITRPLSAVVAAARALQAGHYDRPLEATGADEVAFMARAFDDMRRSLHQSVEHMRSVDRMKSNFIALAGHELKTPLTVISGFNDMLVSGVVGELPEKVRETTQLIQRRLQDLNRLVENILDVTRFEQGLNPLAHVSVDLRDLATVVVQHRKDDLDGRDLTLELDLSPHPCRVAGDGQRLRQALSHLVDNAVRFTQDGGRVTVATQRDGDRVRLVVRDTGIGIPADEIVSIFEKARDVRDVLHHSSGHLQFGSRGLGVGLALTKAIVEGHDGTLRVRSAVGGGSEFTIELIAATHEPLLDASTSDRRHEPTGTEVQDSKSAAYAASAVD